MKASALIEAKLKGFSFDQMIHAVESGRSVVSSLPEETQNFYDEMLNLVVDGTKSLESAVGSYDFTRIQETAHSLREILQMIEDASAKASGSTN